MAARLLGTCARRIGALVVVSGAVALLPVASASAWTSTLSGTELRVDAAAGEANRFEVVSLTDVLLIEDRGGSVHTGSVPAPCSASGAVLQCAKGAVSSLVLHAGDRDDVVDDASDLVATVLDGGDGNDTIYGGGRSDELRGGAGSDTLFGDAGSDVLDGGSGADELYGGDGADQLLGRDGADQLYAGAGADTVDAGEGSDVLDGGDDADELAGGAGNDQIDGGDGPDRLSGDDGADVMEGGSGSDTLFGGEGADRLGGGDGADDLDGGAGDDALDADSGGGRLSGGEGNDVLNGGDDVDEVLGGPGNDDLDGGGAADRLDGQAGDDALAGGTGADALAGGDGSDTVTYDGSSVAVSASLNGLADDGAPGEGDLIAGDVEHLVGSANADTLVGDDQANVLRGGDGDDTIAGGAGADLLDGESGNDTLDGGVGGDVLQGADGVDTVSYAARTQPVIATLQAGAVSGEIGENDQLIDVENLVGGSGADVLFGSEDIANLLVGGPGDDRLVLTGDTVYGDRASCGTGLDSAELDGMDQGDPDCENLTVSGSSVRPGNTATVFVGARTLRVSRSGIVAVQLICPRRTVVRCVISGRLRLRDGRQTVTLARATGRVVAGGAGQVRFRLTSSDLARLRRTGRRTATVSLELTIRDISGARSTRTVPLRVRVPAKTR